MQVSLSMPEPILDAVSQRTASPYGVYVSCNPDAPAAESPTILNAGHRVERIQAVDMFPQALLRSKRGGRIDTARAARRQVAREARHGEHGDGNDDPRWKIERPDTEQHCR
jgi:hypothetical protein